MPLTLRLRSLCAIIRAMRHLCDRLCSALAASLSGALLAGPLGLEANELTLAGDGKALPIVHGPSQKDTFAATA